MNVVGRGDSLLEVDWVRAVAFNPDVYALAARLPKPTQRIGRPRQYPDEALVVFWALIGAFCNARKVASVMRNRDYWAIIRAGMAHCLGEEFVAQVPTAHGPTRNHWLYHVRRLEQHLGDLGDEVRERALAQAHEAGCFNPDRRWSAVPHKADLVAADGKVVRSPIRPRHGDETKPTRHVEGVGWHVEGGEDDGHPEYGCKFALVSARPSDDERAQIVLDVRHQPPGKGYGGEAAISLQAIADIHDKTSGLRGVCYDGAFRGKHRNALMKRGLLVLTPIHKTAAQAKPLRKVTDCRCGRVHDLWSKDGAVCLRSIRIDGEAEIEPLEKIKTERRGRRQSHRWYHLLRLPCGNAVRERIDTTEQDVADGFNRAEHLVQHPPHTEEYTALYPVRNTAESLNSVLEARLWRQRMIAFTTKRQTMVMLAFAIAQNSLERWHREAEEEAPRAA